ncbi:hypothetical protein [Hyphococcus luteus]|uniref:EF-hand domain-containing protein n=1 Tax=Hyphococcus luteus TaxID=2058213 RepID=A0A2S7K5K1_9PROT|nr:hypothetical protein [Marinicaulis flavus]PQA87728.1 hypothetical protein CW354_05035 [Marinicaulis flavus]
MRNSLLKFTAVAGSAFLLSLSPAFAQGGHGGGGGGAGGAALRSTPTMSQPDRDRMKDQDRDKDFDRDMDRDRDRDRLKDMDRDRLYLGAKDRIRLHDHDGDKKLNQSEFNEWRAGAFDAIAPDGKGFTLQQYQAVRLGPGPQGSSNTARRQQMQERADLRKTERFRVMDGNGDGVVTRNEFMKFGNLYYLEADRNDDGMVSEKELNQYHRGM